MQIDFYKCTDAPNKLSKTPTLIESMTGQLNSAVDLVQPVIRVRGTYDMESNYVHIPDFERWYWIEGVELVNNQMFNVTLSCDVLQSFGSYLNADTVKCYDGVSRVDSDTTPFAGENIIFVSIEGVM